jgi:hypothetical protein
MAFIPDLFKAAFSVGKGATKFGVKGAWGVSKSIAQSGGVERALAGGVLGGALGGVGSFVSSDAASIEGRLRDTFSGAMTGIGIGAGAAVALPLGARAIKAGAQSVAASVAMPFALAGVKGPFGAMVFAPKYAYGMLKNSSSSIGAGVKGILGNKYTPAVGAAALMGGGAYSVYNLASPTISDMRSSAIQSDLNVSFNKNAQTIMDMEENGTGSLSQSPLSRRGGYEDLAGSTQGLVQGLHRTRHGRR